MGQAGKGLDHTNPGLTRQQQACLGNRGSLSALFSGDPAAAAARLAAGDGSRDSVSRVGVALVHLPSPPFAAALCVHLRCPRALLLADFYLRLRLGFNPTPEVPRRLFSPIAPSHKKSPSSPLPPPRINTVFKALSGKPAQKTR